MGPAREVLGVTPPLGLSEIVEAADIERKIKWRRERPRFEHVRDAQIGPQLGLTRFGARLLDRTRHEINASRLKTMLREINHIRPGAAANIDGATGRKMLHLDRLRNLRRRNA
jgi:hypothetical protein